MSSDTKYVATPEVAKHFGVAASTVATMVKSGQIPPGSYLRIGRVFRFDLEKVEQALLDQTKVSAESGQLEFDFDNNNE